MSTVSVTARLPAGLVERLDARAGKGGRSKAMSEALEVYLAAVGDERRRDTPEPVSRSSVHPDDDAVLHMIRGKRLSAREAKAMSGWLGIRFDRAEQRLVRSGRIRYVDGIMEVADG